MILRKKKEVGNFLKESISLYVIHNTDTGINLCSDNDEEQTKEMSKCIDITIEACITIKNFNYLFRI